jgi:hypothetical protein
MADQFDVYAADGALIGEIPISPQDLNLLHSGATIAINFHTPRMLRAVLEIMNGSFELIEIGGKIITAQPETAKRYIVMQADIARAMREPDKWIDPDAEGNPPVR